MAYKNIFFLDIFFFFGGSTRQPKINDVFSEFHEDDETKKLVPRKTRLGNLLIFSIASLMTLVMV